MEEKKVFTKEEAMKALNEWDEFCKSKFWKKDGKIKRVGRQKTAEWVSGMLGAAWVMYMMGALDENEFDNFTDTAIFYIDNWDDKSNFKEQRARGKKVLTK